MRKKRMYSIFRKLYKHHNIKVGEPITIIIDQGGLEIFYDETQIVL